MTKRQVSEGRAIADRLGQLYGDESLMRLVANKRAALDNLVLENEWMDWRSLQALVSSTGEESAMNDTVLSDADWGSTSIDELMPMPDLNKLQDGVLGALSGCETKTIREAYTRASALYERNAVAVAIERYPAVHERARKVTALCGDFLVYVQRLTLSGIKGALVPVLLVELDIIIYLLNRVLPSEIQARYSKTEGMFCCQLVHGLNSADFIQNLESLDPIELETQQ